MMFLNKERKVHIQISYNKLLVDFYKEYSSPSRQNRFETICRIIIKESLNNFYLNIVDETGQTLAFRSGGLNERHRSRTTLQTAEDVVESLLVNIEEFILNHPRVGFIICLRSGYNMKMKSVARLLVSSPRLRRSLVAILNQVQIPHNGVRGRKRRRK